MFARGRRLFTVASFLLILVALIHGSAVFLPPPPGSGMALALEQLRAVPLGEMLGMNGNMAGVYQSLWVFMSLSLAALAAANLVVASAEDPSGRLLRRFKILNVLVMAASVALFVHHELAPPAAALSPILLLFLLSLVLPART